MRVTGMPSGEKDHLHRMMRPCLALHSLNQV